MENFRYFIDGITPQEIFLAFFLTGVVAGVRYLLTAKSGDY